MRTKFETIIIGGGQAGLALGYYLAQQGRDFVILDANRRTGDSWRSRWDSLRLFTPGQVSSLPGMAFPAAPNHIIGKDEMADYLESYAGRFQLPVLRDTRAEALTRNGDRYFVEAGGRRYEAGQIAVATGAHQSPRIPAFAGELDGAIVQIHSSQYRNPEGFPADNTLVVGAGNSGAEIALELARTRRVWLAGSPAGRIPRLPPAIASILIWWFVHRATITDTKFGRLIKKNRLNKGTPLESATEKDFRRAGVERLPGVVGVQDGKPRFADGRVLDASSIIWATGFRPDFRWIKLPVFGADGQPVHYRGVVAGEPGLYFIGLPFIYAISSGLIGGVGRDAEYIAAQIAVRAGARRTAAARGAEPARQAVLQVGERPPAE